MATSKGTVVVEISGKVLSQDSGINLDNLRPVFEVISLLQQQEYQPILILGCENFQEVIKYDSLGIDRFYRDLSDRLLSLVNGVVIYDQLNKSNYDSVLLTDFESTIEEVTEKYLPELANKYLQEGKLVLYMGGVENGLYDVDLSASLRSAELKAVALVKLTDEVRILQGPEKGAVSYSYEQAIALPQDLPIRKSSISLCAHNRMPIIVISPDSLQSINPLEVNDEVTVYF